MRRGPKLTDPNTKKLAGTYKPSVDGAVASIAEPQKDKAATPNLPVAPSWLTKAALDVWKSEIDRAVACGATATDSQMFAMFCTTMADFIASVQAGNPANAAFRSELRKQMEMLGMAGAKSRLARIGAQEQAKPTSFTVFTRKAA